MWLLHPAMILAAKSLLDENPNPSESQVREALSGFFAGTGYLKPVQAILRAAAILRGESRRQSACSQEWISDQPKDNAIPMKLTIRVDWSCALSYATRGDYSTN